jgi:CysZ protein
MLSPISRAIAQLQDPVFLGVVWRSLLLSAVVFLALLAGSVWTINQVVAQPGWLGWLAGAAGGIGAALLALWLFVPVALLISTLYMDRVAAAVDRRFYPDLPVPLGAPLAVQAWDGLALGAQVLALQVLALLLAILLPGVGIVLGWLVAGWAIGRGLFMGVAMRRMGRPEALRTYAAQRFSVLVQGVALALAGSVPGLNLLVPVVGTAAMVHVLNRRRSRAAFVHTGL